MRAMRRELLFADAYENETITISYHHRTYQHYELPTRQCALCRRRRERAYVRAAKTQAHYATSYDHLHRDIQ